MNARWSEQGLRRFGLGGFSLIVALVVHTVLMVPGVDGSPGLTHDGFGLSGLYFAGVSALAVTSLLLVWFRPRNSVGWLLGLSGFLGALCEWGQVYGARALVVESSQLLFGSLVLSWSAPLWVASLLLPATLLLARYPSGRLTGRWARRVDRVVVIALVLLWIGYAGSPESVTDEVQRTTPPVLLPDLMAVTLVVGSAVVLLVAALVIAGMTFRRLHLSTWPERPQLALLLTATTLTVALVFLSPWDWLGLVSFALLPVAIAVGVLRYRLMGIEVVVRRTLLYGALTGLVLLVFVAVTSALATLVPSGPAPQVVAASAVAVVLVPARDRLQQFVDRLVYGDRNDPWKALSHLGTRVENASGAGLPDVVAAVAQSLRLPGAQVRVPGGTLASWGVLDGDLRSVDLQVRGELVGDLLVAPRPGERALGEADGRLLAALAPMVAVVVQVTTLAEDLRVERERVVRATEVERDRLRRDLHDGLGPSLTGIGLGLEAVDTAALPERARGVVKRLRAEVGASLEEVRRILEDLRPGVLESTDLLGHLRTRAAHLTASTPLRVEVVAPTALPYLPSPMEAAALRIVEEAVNNVVRHARATTCTVTVRLDDELHLDVVDDGIGFLVPRQDGVGLGSMRARAQALGGRLDLISCGEGTRLTVSLPVGVLT